MEKIYIFIEKSLEGFKNFSFDVDTELKQAKIVIMANQTHHCFMKLVILERILR